MNTRLIKEARALLPLFAVLVCGVTGAARFWSGDTAVSIAIFFLVTCSAVMAASSFGHEFQGRTMAGLLAQPVSRTRLWFEKMGVLGVTLFLGYSAFLISSYCAGVNNSENFLPFAVAFTLVPLGLLCSSPFLTLTIRNTILAAVSAVCLPGLISQVLVGLGAAYVKVFPQHAAFFREPTVWQVVLTLTVPSVIYSALCYGLGYRKFMKLEAIDSQAVEFSLKPELESALVRPFRRLLPGYTGPWASLFRKELRLQQISFLVAAVFVLMLLLGAALHLLNIRIDEGRQNISEYVWIIAFSIYLLLIPFLAGAMAVAEEKSWGVAEWQMMLPPSLRKQWCAKILVALATSLVLGVILPLVLGSIGQIFFGNPTQILVPWMAMPTFILVNLLLTSLVLYAATHVGNTIRAMMLALGMLSIAGVLVKVLCSYALSYTAFLGDGWNHSNFLGWLFVHEAALLAVLFNYYAFTTYRARELPLHRRVSQGVTLACVFSIFVLVYIGAMSMIGRLN